MSPTPNYRRPQMPAQGANGGVSFEQFQKNQAKLRQDKFGDNPGGSKIQPWQMRMKYFFPSDIPTKMRLIPTTPDEPFYKYHQAWITTGTRKVNVIGNSHNGEKPVPDLVYYYAIEEGNDDFLTKANYAITCVVLEQFHPIKKASASDKSKSYTVYERCLGKDIRGRVRCDECKKNSETSLGQQYYWSMGARTREQLTDLLDNLKHRCVNCFRGTLMVNSFECPSCKETIADLGQDDVSDEDLQALHEADIDCPHCGKSVRATENSQCVLVRGSGENATYDEGCGKPTRGPVQEDIFAYDIELRSVKVGNNYMLEIDKFWPITKVAVPEGMLRPMPLPLFLSHMTLKEQADKLGKANVYGDDGEKRVAAYFRDEGIHAAEDKSAKDANTPESAESVDWGDK